MAAQKITRIQMRRDAEASWMAADPVLESGEFGVETGSMQFKIGNGLSSWSALSFYGAGGGSDLNLSDIQVNLRPGKQGLDVGMDDARFRDAYLYGDIHLGISGSEVKMSSDDGQTVKIELDNPIQDGNGDYHSEYIIPYDTSTLLLQAGEQTRIFTRNLVGNYALPTPIGANQSQVNQWVITSVNALDDQKVNHLDMGQPLENPDFGGMAAEDRVPQDGETFINVAVGTVDDYYTTNNADRKSTIAPGTTLNGGETVVFYDGTGPGWKILAGQTPDVTTMVKAGPGISVDPGASSGEVVVSISDDWTSIPQLVIT